MTWLGVLADVATVVACFIAVAVYLRSLRDDLRGEVQTVGRRVDGLATDLRYRLDALTTAVLEMTHLFALRRGMRPERLADFQTHLRRLVLDARPVAGNPLPPDELARFTRYADTLAERPLTLQEAADLKYLAEKVAQQHPESPEAQGLTLGAMFYLAFLEAIAEQQPA